MICCRKRNAILRRRILRQRLIRCRNLLPQQPDVAYGHFELAYVFTALQKADEARGEYERAIAIDPKMAEAYLNLGILFIERDPAVAVPNLRKAVELLPAQSRPRYLLGVAQENAKDYSAAAESFEGAYRLDPHNLEPILHLANLYMRLQRPADAEAKFRSILEAQPNNAAGAAGRCRMPGRGEKAGGRGCVSQLSACAAYGFRSACAAGALAGGAAAI